MLKVRWRRATAAPTARRSRASAEFPPTITCAIGWTRLTRASATVFRTHGDAAGRAAPAAGLRSAGRQNPDRLGRDAVFLLAKAQLSKLPHPRALQRQKRELSLPAVGDGRGARPPQGRSFDAQVRRHPGRRAEAFRHEEKVRRRDTK